MRRLTLCALLLVAAVGCGGSGGGTGDPGPGDVAGDPVPDEAAGEIGPGEDGSADAGDAAEVFPEAWEEVTRTDAPSDLAIDVPPTCGTPRLEGRLAVWRFDGQQAGDEMDLVFDTVEARLSVRSAPGSREDGCVGAVTLDLRTADGCRLLVMAEGGVPGGGSGDAGGLTIAEEGLPVTEALLEVVGACASRLGVPADEYVEDELKTRFLRVDPKRLPDAAVSPACVDVAIEVVLYGAFRGPSGDLRIGVDSADVGYPVPAVLGPVPFDLDPDLPCPFGCSCEGRKCGDDGCGGSCGTCKDCDGSDVPWCESGTCPVLCCPNCGNRVCGDDGCGGLCGTCDGDTVCDPIQGACVAHCTDLPASWGPAGVVAGLDCPATKEVSQAACFDYTGDGLGDNGLRYMSGQLAGPFADLAGRFAVAVEPGVSDLTADGSFAIWLVPVEASAGGQPGEVLADRLWMSPLDCLPRVRMAAQFQGGVLTAHADRAEVPVQMEGLSRQYTPVVDLRLRGTVLPGGGPGGFELQDGVFGALWRVQDYGVLMEAWRAQCNAIPKEQWPSSCDYLFVTTEGWPFDLVCADDGTCVPKTYYYQGNALSACLTFALTPATVVGYQP